MGMAICKRLLTDERNPEEMDRVHRELDAFFSGRRAGGTITASTAWRLAKSLAAAAKRDAARLSVGQAALIRTGC